MYAMVVGKNEAMNWNEVEDPIMASDEVLVEILCDSGKSC